MRERMNNIMSIVKAMQPLDFIDFSEASEDRFIIKTACPECLTFVRWEATAFLTIEITHILGYLDVDKGISPIDFIRILQMNFESNQGGTYYGVYHNQDKDILNVSQSASQIFLPKWNDEDIADAITAIFSRIAGNIIEPPKPIIKFEIETPLPDWLNHKS